MKVERQLLHDAWRGYQMVTHRHRCVWEFVYHFNITTKQWHRFTQSGKLHVRRDSHIKLTLMAKLPGTRPEYMPAMIAAYLANYGVKK